MLRMVGFKLNVAKSEPGQEIQFLGIPLLLDLGRALLPESKTWEIVAVVYNLSSQSVLLFQQVFQFMGLLNSFSGLVPLGLQHLRPLQQHFHSVGLTNHFTPPPDHLVHDFLLRHWRDIAFLTTRYWNSLPTISDRYYHIYRCHYTGLGRP